MINPSDLISNLIADIKAMDGYNDLGLDDIIEINEKPSKKVKPPYAGIYFDYDKTADQRSSVDELLALPVSIKIMLFSGGYETAGKAFAEIFEIANTIKDNIHSEFLVDTKTVKLYWDEIPFQVLQKTASQSVLRLNLFYKEWGDL